MKIIEYKLVSYENHVVHSVDAVNEGAIRRK